MMAVGPTVAKSADTNHRWGAGTNMGYGRGPMTSERAMSPNDDRQAVQVFVWWDRIGTLAGLALVVVANLFLTQPLLWVIAATLVGLAASLTMADRLLGQDRLTAALAVIAAGNWITALVVASVLPFLWPVMAITVLMPLVLATPYLPRSRIGIGIGAAAMVAGAVCVIGLINDDGGALPDLEDEIELVVVVAALMGQIAPVGLIVHQNNRLQRAHLDRAAALNADLEQSRERLAASRRRVVEAADTERRRIERNLHDGAQQRLVALGVRLRLLETLTGDDEPVQTQLTALITELDEAIEEVRELAHGIYPPLLQTRGLVDALSAVARRSPLPVTTDLDDVGRFDPSTEAALYFTALEALTNAAKHAPDSSVDVALSTEGGLVRLTVGDDGPGFDPETTTPSGQGMTNMADRLASSGGDLVVTSKPGQGTTVEATVPLGQPTP